MFAGPQTQNRRLGLTLAGHLALQVAVHAGGVCLAQEPAAGRGRTTTSAGTTESMRDATARESDMRDARARAHFRLASELYTLGRFDEAQTEFREAYALSSRPELLYNIFLAARDGGHQDQAIAALHDYLAAVPNAPNRDQLQARLQAMEAEQADRLAAQQAAERDREIAARERELAQQQAALAHQRAEAAERDLARQRELNPRRPWWPWLLVGGGVVAIGGSIGLGVLTQSDRTQLSRDCVGGEQMLACNPSVNATSRVDQLRLQAGIVDGLWLVGGLALATGVVLAFVLPNEVDAAPRQPALSGIGLICDASACYSQAHGTF